jgi:hypothetical protein
MSRAPFSAALIHRTRPALSAALLLACLAGSAVASAQEMEPPATEQRANADTVAQEQTFKKTIAGIESTQGAYSSALSEQLLSLGLALQSQGRHDEAVDLFKRGVHLTRINDGLYSTQQVPLLQGQISSHIALGDYAQADERQHYMYRVQVRNKDNGEPLAAALMQQAGWQRNAYFLGIGAQGYSRIMNMWDMYRLALNEIIAREGDTSPNLLRPLHGMLEAQYLISEYDWEDQSHNSSDDLGARQDLNRFMAYRAQSYQKGSAVITAMHDIELQREGEQNVATARALAMLGDWQLWHDKRDTAWQTYQDAMVELAGRDDAQLQIDHLFGEPVALPDVAGVRPLPPTVDTAEADILLEFGVTERGRVVNLARLDEHESDNRDARAHRLMRKLRKTKFRPRFEAGQPVETEKIVRAFNIE